MMLAERQKLACVAQNPLQSHRVNANTAGSRRAGAEQLGVHRRVPGSPEKLIKAPLRGATGANAPPSSIRCCISIGGCCAS